jgi:hypothetical protein
MHDRNQYSNGVAGINDEEMKKTIINVYDIAEKLQRKFNEIDELFINAQDYINCPGASDIFSKYQNFKSNYDIAVANVRGYGDDLNKVRINFHNMIKEAADYLKF